MSTSTDLSINNKSNVSIRERIGVSGSASYDSQVLVDNDIDREIRIGFSNDESRDYDGFFIEMSGYHIKNDESGRAFHASFDGQLSRDDLKRLHDYIGFLLTIPD